MSYDVNSTPLPLQGPTVSGPGQLPATKESSDAVQAKPKVFQGAQGDIALRNLTKFASKLHCIKGSQLEVKQKLLERVAAGEKIANDINSGAYARGEVGPPSAQDVSNLEWWMRAHTALPTTPNLRESHQLFDKGSMKMADPDGYMAHFFATATGSRDGEDFPAYGRWASHWVEEQPDSWGDDKRCEEFGMTKDSKPLPDGSVLCFSKKAAERATAEGKQARLFKGAAIGLDFRGTDKNGEPLELSGRNSGTMMVMVGPGWIGLKNEGFSAAPLTAAKDLKQAGGLAREGIRHINQFFKKLTGKKDRVIWGKSRGEDRLSDAVRKKADKLKKHTRKILQKHHFKLWKKSTRLGNPAGHKTLVKLAGMVSKTADNPDLVSRNKRRSLNEKELEQMQQNAEELVELIHNQRLQAQRSLSLGGVAMVSERSERLLEARAGEVLLPSIGDLMGQEAHGERPPLSKEGSSPFANVPPTREDAARAA